MEFKQVKGEMSLLEVRRKLWIEEQLTKPGVEGQG